MRNVAKRMMNKDLASCVTVWREQQKAEAFELEARARGERIMKNVAKRMLNREVASCVIVWHDEWRSYVDEERGLGIMRRVGARMMKKDVVVAVSTWKDKANKGVLEMVSMDRTHCLLFDWLGLAVAAASGEVAAHGPGA